ncbi:acetylcholine receptor subunit alpha-like [Ylistrum balloti]|uniref:acetylcholine receptor subunit alpha-like n=1 Tax=Ylistrum balloti TaxID=509963 RepID=UPI002905A6A5|nr:acetylcholine receptor subunit alpha-like [Ylistrum balloti]
MTAPRVILALILCCGAGQSVLGRTGTMDHWIRLTNALFSNYTKDIYPVYYLNETLTVDLSMFLLSIQDFDEVAGVITLNGGLLQSWADFRLTWNPSDYGGIEDIFLNSSVVWKPHVILVSSAEDLKPFDSGKFDVRVFYNGTCQINPGRRMLATCSVDMTKFPSDSHVCDLEIMQWSVLPDEVVLGFTSTELILTYYIQNGEWDIVKTSVSNPTLSPGGVIFTINVTRKPEYLSVSLILPILLVCFLNPFVFLLPASSGERISYTLTLFLSLAVYISIIASSLPNVSNNMAMMSFFLLIILIISGVIIVMTIFTLRYDVISDVSKFPNFLKRLALCIYEKKPVNKDECEKDANVNSDDTEHDLKRDDVIKLIDISLFVTSSLMMVIFVTWFLCFVFV